MENRLQIWQRLAGAVVGGAFAVIAVFMVVLGLTLLPVVGLLVAIPLMTLSLYFLFPNVHLLREQEDGTFLYEQHDTWCPWPPVNAHRQGA